MTARKYFSEDRITLVESEDLKSEELLSKVIREIERKAGLPPRQYNVIYKNARNSDTKVRNMNAQLSAEMTAKLAAYYAPQKKEFFQLIGRDLG